MVFTFIVCSSTLIIFVKCDLLFQITKNGISGFVWSSAIHLACYIIDNHTLFEKKHILEVSISLNIGRFYFTYKKLFTIVRCILFYLL